MPSKVDDKRIPRVPGIDRRMKLSEREKAEIRANVEGLSQRGLAAKYNVSRRTIQFVQSPEKLAANVERRKERGGHRAYYDKEAHREATRRHRDHKKHLDEKGILL